MIPSIYHKTYLITGAASGIGAATARLWHAQGAHLLLCDLQADALQTIAAELNAPFAVVDVTQPTQVQAAVQQALDHYGRLDGVIHCAGILRAGLMGTVDLEFQRRTIEVNLFGTYTIAQAALPHLQQSQGKLVLLASISGFYGSPEYSAYAASKAGVINLAQTLRLELDQSGVYIGVVCPYYVQTPMVTDNQHAKLVQALGVRHTPEDIAQAILGGIQRRSFMVLPTLSVKFVWFMSHYVHWLMYPVLRRTWRRAQHL